MLDHGAGRRTWRGRWLVLALVATSTIARAETITLEPAKDNTLFEDSQGRFSNGAGTGLFAGRVDPRMNGLIRRGLIAFDIAASLPAGATITAVTLRLNMSMTVAGPRDVSLHRVLADWGEGNSDALGNEGGGAPASEGDATWLHTFSDTERWASPGGDFASTPSATASVGSLGPYTWGSTPGLVADVQSWFDEPEANFGWMIVGDEASARTAKRFDSRESSAVSRPRLTIDFEVATPTATATPTQTPTATPTPTITPTRVPPRCVGDCDGDGTVTVAEVVVGVEIGLGRASLLECEDLDTNDDGRAQILELIEAVDSSFGCISEAGLGARGSGLVPIQA